ncbi:uncharacterized protein LOC108672591 [Hyalella azteca]|uniref:Uncharacterized protein LOC108672591 n=1 Tax=Hyalella azteca TaxID=294128 RepID=A0A8B7NPY9_HYAAZ|nr:uncharacterized protein LOC108672591 [Hyalella azteca]
MELIGKAGRFYRLSSTEIAAQKDDLKAEIKRLFEGPDEDVFWKPNILLVMIKADDLRSKLKRWRRLVQLHPKDIKLYLHNQPTKTYQPNDDLIRPMLNTQVKVIDFDGCVGTSEGVTALGAVTRGARLNLYLATPLDLTNLSGTAKELVVYTRPLLPDTRTYALPAIPRPWLCVYIDGPVEESWNSVAYTITHFAPAGEVKRFEELWLCNSMIRPDEVNQLLDSLQAAKVRTHSEGNTRASPTSSANREIWLHVTETSRANS